MESLLLSILRMSLDSMWSKFLVCLSLKFTRSNHHSCTYVTYIKDRRSSDSLGPPRWLIRKSMKMAEPMGAEVRKTSVAQGHSFSAHLSKTTSFLSAERQSLCDLRSISVGPTSIAASSSGTMTTTPCAGWCRGLRSKSKSAPASRCQCCAGDDASDVTEDKVSTSMRRVPRARCRNGSVKGAATKALFVNGFRSGALTS
mmetsp:Transcript_34652/g.88179  ORF Transcript_34652/g.88179 Transcript_34652/m.88179 type:complete len:200 (-) Transcript_34652:193-792(-)